MPEHERFEWDEAKSKSNLRKHKVSFTDAATILADPFGHVFHLTWLDERCDEIEDRWITVGSHPYNRQIVLVIGWTQRGGADLPVTRVISARAATPAERRNYEAKTYPI